MFIVIAVGRTQAKCCREFDFRSGKNERMLIGNLKERITGDARALARRHHSSYAINVLGIFFFFLL